MPSGIYGDMLASFPELLEDFEIFQMRPNYGAGYGERFNERKVTGYLSWIKGGKYGVAGDARVENQNLTFWVEDGTDSKGIIRQGDFIEVDGDLYIFNHDDGFSREGGFIVYTLQVVPAHTDKQLPNRGVDYGASDYN